MPYETRNLHHAIFLAHRNNDFERKDDPYAPGKSVFVFPNLDSEQANTLLAQFYVPICNTCGNCPYVLLTQRVMPRR